MIAVPLRSEDLARVRWAPSPIFETLAWLRLTADRRVHPRLGDPGPAARFAMRQPDVAFIAAVVRGVGGYMPDLFTPKPAAGHRRHPLGDQLDVVRETTPETVQDQYAVADAFVPARLRHALDSDTFAGRIANGLQTFWRVALSDNWSSIDEALTADVYQRAKLIAGQGIGAALDTLHPGIGWYGDQLRVGIACDESLPSQPYADLVLAPSILSWSGISAQVTDPDNSVITYAVTQLAPGGERRLRSSASLLGPTRAAILDSLDVPRSTTELSRRHGLAASTVSHHLGVLLDAGMAVKIRHGAFVHYVRTARGDALVG